MYHNLGGYNFGLLSMCIGTNILSFFYVRKNGGDSFSIGIIVSIISLCVSLRQKRRQNQIETEFNTLKKQLFETQLSDLKDKREPKIDLRLEKYLKSYKFIIENNGGTKSYDVDIEYLPEEGKLEPISENDVNNLFPIKEMRPDIHHTFQAFIANDSYPPFKFNVKWKDKDGNEFVEEQLVTIS